MIVSTSRVLTDLAFIVYLGVIVAVVIRTYFWLDILAWWRNWRDRRTESERLNRLWEAGGFDE